MKINAAGYHLQIICPGGRKKKGFQRSNPPIQARQMLSFLGIMSLCVSASSCAQHVRVTTCHALAKSMQGQYFMESAQRQRIVKHTPLGNFSIELCQCDRIKSALSNIGFDQGSIPCEPEGLWCNWQHEAKLGTVEHLLTDPALIFTLGNAKRNSQKARNRT